MENKAIFLDRDGVINNPGDNYYVWKTEEFVLNNHIINTLKKYQDSGYLLIIISNQGGIAKGIYSKIETDKVHEYLKSELLKHEIFITEIYYCPHHSDVSNCLCRKPKSLLIEKAVARFSIDIPKSFLIGDSNRDIEAAENIGLRGILIRKNASLPDIL